MNLDFEEFKQHVNKWMARLDVTGWRIGFAQRQMPDTALTTYDSVAKIACFQLTIEQSGDFCRWESSDDLALHEVIHLLLADLVRTAAVLGDDTHNLVVAREHEVVHKLVAALRGSA